MSINNRYFFKGRSFTASLMNSKFKLKSMNLLNLIFCCRQIEKIGKTSITEKVTK